MSFKDLSYKKPKGTVRGSVKKRRGKDTGKNVQGSSERIQKTAGEGSADTGDS